MMMMVKFQQFKENKDSSDRNFSISGRENKARAISQDLEVKESSVDDDDDDDDGQVSAV